MAGRMGRLLPANLAHHWPDVPRYGDVTAVDWRGVEPVDLIAGGFPCQPVSSAGKQLAQSDDRWLWPEFARAVGALRPRYVLVENVAALLTVNGGGAFGEVIGDLAALGYDAEWECISASDVGAPHKRDRLWIVAYSNGGGQQGGGFAQYGEQQGASGGEPDGRGARRRRDGPPMAHTDGQGPPHAGEGDARGRVDGSGPGAHRAAAGGGSPPDVADAASGRSSGPWQPVDASDPAAAGDWQATQPVDGGITNEWGVEPDVGRVAHGVPARVDRLRALGNAVVPQIPEWIGRRILEAERVA